MCQHDSAVWKEPCNNKLIFWNIIFRYFLKEIEFKKCFCAKYLVLDCQYPRKFYQIIHNFIVFQLFLLSIVPIAFRNLSKFTNPCKDFYFQNALTVRPQLKTSIRLHANRVKDPIEQQIASNIKRPMNKRLLLRPFLFTVGVSLHFSNVFGSKFQFYF